MPSSARGMRMLNGIAAAAVALGVAQLMGIGFGPRADALNGVGSAVIDLTPGAAKEWAIRTFGTADKLFLLVMVVAVIAGVAAGAGIWERRRVPGGSIAIVVAAIAGCAAIISRPGATAVDIIPTIVGMCCGVAVLRLLIARVPAEVPETAGEVADPGRRLSLAALGWRGSARLSRCRRRWCAHPRCPTVFSKTAWCCRASSPATRISIGSTPRCWSHSLAAATGG